MAQESQRDRTTLHDTSWQRPYVRAAIRQFFPTLDDPNGPALDAYLIHDAQLRAYQGTLTQRGSDRIGAADLRRALPAYSTHDAWTVIDPATLRGIVRGNVRVIWVHHDPEPQDTMPTVEEQVRRLQPNMALSTVEVDSGVARQLEQKLEQLRWQQRDEALRALARQSEPAAFAAHTAIALIVDSENRLVAHTSGIEEPGRRSCVDVVKRLLPAYRNTQFAISGCMITDPKNGGVVYWGQVSNR